ncbi:MAG: hypothetical protein U0487_03525 [Patescibacteria group bacterium]
MRDLRALCRIQPEETVLCILRLHHSALWLSVLPWGLLLCGVSFFLFFLLRGGAFGAVVAGLLVSVSVYGIVRGFALWDGTALVLTNKRLISLSRRQLWSRTCEEMPLADIRQIEARRRGSWRRLLKLSTITIKGGQNQQFQLPSVSGVDRFAEALKEARKML